MILNNSEQWVELYKLIKEESKKSEEKHVHIYVSAADTDSVCALRILEVRSKYIYFVSPLHVCLTKQHFIRQNLFQNDMVPHGWTAVSRYQEVIEDFLATYDEEDPVTRFVILINCGASEHVGDLLGLAQRPHVCVVIVDAHRPIEHHANDNNTFSQVFMLLDSVAENLYPADIPTAYDDDDELYDEDDVGDGDDGDDDDDDDDDDNDQETEGDPNQNQNQRRRLEDGSYAPSSATARGRGSTSASVMKRRERKQREDTRFAYYGRGTSYGKPSACVLFDLAYQLQQDSSYMLWLALVGLTDHLVHGRMLPEKYEEYYLAYEGHVVTGGHMDDAPEMQPIDGGGEKTGAVAAVTCRIAIEDDFRFGLLREWTLWDAMAHSPYVASRLHTYTDKGRERLEFLLIKMGIPLREAKGLFALDMKPSYRRKLQEQLALHGVSYNLGDAIFKSFQLQDGYRRCVMAVDVVHAATALLESGSVRGVSCTGGSNGSTKASNPTTNTNTNTAGGGDANGTTADADDNNNNNNNAHHSLDHRDRFWRCWNALSWKDDDGELRRGIELAKKVQKALVADGGSVIVQRLYHNFRAFRIFDLSDHQLSHRSLLAHPMALQRMAAFLQEQHLHQSQNNRKKPLVLVGPKDPITRRCLVVGYQVSQPGSGGSSGTSGNQQQGNQLGKAFVEASEGVSAMSWHDLFDTSIMEIAGDDVERFKAELLRVASDLL